MFYSKKYIFYGYKDQPSMTFVINYNRATKHFIFKQLVLLLAIIPAVTEIESMITSDSHDMII